MFGWKGKASCFRCSNFEICWKPKTVFVRVKQPRKSLCRPVYRVRNESATTRNPDYSEVNLWSKHNRYEAVGEENTFDPLADDIFKQYAALRSQLIHEAKERHGGQLEMLWLQEI